MPGNNMFINGFDGLATKGLPGARKSFRQYSTYRTVTIPGAERPPSISVARSTIKHDFKLAEKVGALRPKAKELSIVATPEFARNGRMDPFEQGWVYDARNRISVDMYKAMRDEAYKAAKSHPAGSLYLFGSSAIDLDRRENDGTQLGENRGFLVSTGPSPQLMEYSKKSKSSIDGWDDTVTVKTGSGPKSITLKDASGDGRDVLLSIAVCLDYAHLVHDERFPLEADLVIAPSAGWPGATMPPPGDRNIEVLVADASNFMEGGLWNTGVWRYDKEFPLLGRAFERYKKLSSGSVLGTATVSILSSMIQNSERLRGLVEEQNMFGRREYTVENVDGYPIIRTTSRPFPNPKNNDGLGRFAQRVMNEGASMATNGAALPAKLLSAESGNEGESPIDPYLRNPLDPPPGEPGGSEEPPPEGEFGG